MIRISYSKKYSQSSTNNYLSILTLWMSPGLLKSSKQKQKLYNKFLKHKTYRHETNYKTYKNIFAKIKKGFKESSL